LFLFFFIAFDFKAPLATHTLEASFSFSFSCSFNLNFCFNLNFVFTCAHPALHTFLSPLGVCWE